jgi:hypothetical protein
VTTQKRSLRLLLGYVFRVVIERVVLFSTTKMLKLGLINMGRKKETPQNAS